MSIGKFCSNLILTTNLTNTEILAKAKKAFPDGKTSMACIAWYKSDLRKKGLIAKRGAPALDKPLEIPADVVTEYDAHVVA